jgi:hypothetical protein
MYNSINCFLFFMHGLIIGVVLHVTAVFLLLRLQLQQHKCSAAFHTADTWLRRELSSRDPALFLRALLITRAHCLADISGVRVTDGKAPLVSAMNVRMKSDEQELIVRAMRDIAVELIQIKYVVAIFHSLCFDDSDFIFSLQFGRLVCLVFLLGHAISAGFPLSNLGADVCHHEHRSRTAHRRRNAKIPVGRRGQGVHGRQLCQVRLSSDCFNQWFELFSFLICVFQAGVVHFWHNSSWSIDY